MWFVFECVVPLALIPPHGYVQTASHSKRRVAIFTNCPLHGLFLDSQISLPPRLILVTRRDDIPAIPARGAPVRVMGRQFPSAGGTGLAVRQTDGSAFRPATFGAPLSSDGDAKGSKPTIWHDSPPGCAARQRSRTAQQRRRKSRCRNLRSQLSTSCPALCRASTPCFAAK